MGSNIVSLLRDTSGAFRAADAVDIALVAIVVYVALIWCQETGSRRVMVGIVALTCIFFASRKFNLYLTSQLLHVGFSIALIMLVVIFQEDLRRVFERMTSGSIASFNKPLPTTFESDVLVEAAFDLASKKHGALVILKGNEPLARHTHGGIELSGKVSKPLLDSIFDPGSAGHDGAVLIEAGKISKFAVHLPISKNRSEVGPLGTRHAAALGVSERADALTIVVSEERGVVSLAEGGKLEIVHSAAELKKRLDGFVRRKFPKPTEAFWSHFVARHWIAKLLSITLAFLAWLLFAYNPATVQRTFVVPIEYHNVPRGLEIDDAARNETRVTLSGTEPAFRFLEPATLKVAVDLANSQPGSKTINVIPKKNLAVPGNLSVYRIEHSTISLYLNERSDPVPEPGKNPAKGIKMKTL